MPLIKEIFSFIESPLGSPIALGLKALPYGQIAASALRLTPEIVNLVEQYFGGEISMTEFQGRWNKMLADGDEADDIVQAFALIREAKEAAERGEEQPQGGADLQEQPQT